MTTIEEWRIEKVRELCNKHGGKIEGFPIPAWAWVSQSVLNILDGRIDDQRGYEEDDG